VDLTQKNGASARARVKWINAVGPAVKVELELLDAGKSVEVELTRERYLTLRLSVGEIVYVTPKGLKVFVGTYAI
jgi:sulfate transport system ATP-binding protein